MPDKLPKIIRLGDLQIEFTHHEFDLINLTIKSFDDEGEVEEIINTFINYEDLKDLIKFFWGSYLETKRSRDHAKAKAKRKKEDANNNTDIINVSGLLNKVWKNL